MYCVFAWFGGLLQVYRRKLRELYTDVTGDEVCMRASIIKMFCTTVITISFLVAMYSYAPVNTWQQITWVCIATLLSMFGGMIDFIIFLDAAMNELTKDKTNDQ